MFEYTNYTKPTRIGHQADQEMFEYTNYTKPTRIGHQADQEMFEYTNYTKPTRIRHQADQERLGYTNYTKPTRIRHQADQERLGYTNYTKPTRIGHQADQERLGYSNYTKPMKPTLLFVRNMPLAVAARDPSTEIPLLGARQCSCAGSFKSILVSLDVPRPTKSSCSDLVVCKQHSTSKDDHLTVPYISYG